MDLRRLAKRGVFGLLGSVVALGVIWVGAHVVLAEARPEPFAKATDLPALPPAEDNGFLTIARATTTRAPSAPKSVPTLTTKPAEFPSWGQVELARGPLRTYLDAAETKAALTLIDGALAKPSFVDGCADRFDTTCTVISLLSATRAESYLVLSLALDGQNDEATRRLERLLRAELSWLHTPRSYVSQRVSLSSARATVHLAGLLAPRLSPTQRATLLPAVAAFATQPVDLSRLVKLTYLEEMAALDYVVSTSSGFHLASPTAPPRAPTLSERFVSQRLLDRGRTERALADRARQTLRWAEKGDVPPPPPTHESESVLAWVYNPVGKILLDSWIAPPQWESTRDDARALVREAAAIDLR